MMASGEISAGFTGPAGIGRAGPPTGAWEQGGQKPAETYPELIENAPQVEADWFKRTGIYPIHGSVVIKTEVLEKHPHVAKSLYDAFVASKQIYMDKLKSGEGDSADDRKYRGLMPVVGDPLPYGLEGERRQHRGDADLRPAAGPDPAAHAAGRGLRRCGLARNAGHLRDAMAQSRGRKPAGAR